MLEQKSSAHGVGITGGSINFSIAAQQRSFCMCASRVYWERHTDVNVLQV